MKQTKRKGVNPVYKITGKIARDKAKIIDSQIIPFIPKWQLKLLMACKIPLLNNLLGSWGSLNQRIIALSQSFQPR